LAESLLRWCEMEDDSFEEFVKFKKKALNTGLSAEMGKV
jgi:hypothetical protein